MLGGADTTVLGGTVDTAETADTDGLAEVDVAGNAGGTNVEPVDVLGGKLARRAGLDSINPACRGLLVSYGYSLTENAIMAKYVPGMGSLPWRVKKLA